MEAIRRLKRHKHPFAGALKLVNVTDVRSSPNDAKYTSLVSATPTS